ALTYAIAFSDDLTAKDVTRRYTRTYAAKVLKTRVDVSPWGKEWLTNVFNLFQYRGSATNNNNNMGGKNKSDRDIIEDHELARKEAAEPMPRNIQDFRSHPVYALERHLRRNEIIHPKREVGKISSSSSSTSASNKTSESIFRRQDVHICRTADQWFRLGREINEQEQPVKRLPPPLRRQHQQQQQQRKKQDSPPPPPPLTDDNDDEEHDQEEGGKPLYLEHQTKPYTPPPIPTSGHPIPRNAYGNLDIYTPSMVPARGYHSAHPLSAHAAKILGVDAVDAVTGFSFSGVGGGGSGGGSGGGMRRYGKPLITGAIIYAPHRAAVEA
ncbi:MAG: hypothetical protein Q9216_007258, partial [Gyalolechia sp. 2 TL-2023]